MISIPLDRFRATLSATLLRVQRGESIVITRGGHAVAQVTPIRDAGWKKMNVIRPIVATRPRVTARKGTGKLSHEIVAERRRRG